MGLRLALECCRSGPDHHRPYGHSRRGEGCQHRLHPNPRSFLRCEIPSAAHGQGFVATIALAECGNMPIHPRQAVHHQPQIQGRELAVCFPFQAGETQAASVADRSVGVRQGGPPGCMCFKSFRFLAPGLLPSRGIQRPKRGQNQAIQKANHSSAANLLPEHTLST